MAGSRPERFVVNVVLRNPPIGERGDEALHHRRGTADVKLMAARRQCAAQKIEVNVSGMLEVAALHVAGAWPAVDHVEVQARMRTGQLFQYRLERMLAAVTEPIVEMNGTLRLLGKAPA